MRGQCAKASWRWPARGPPVAAVNSRRRQVARHIRRVGQIELDIAARAGPILAEPLHDRDTGNGGKGSGVRLPETHIFGAHERPGIKRSQAHGGGIFAEFGVEPGQLDLAGGTKSEIRQAAGAGNHAGIARYQQTALSDAKHFRRVQAQRHWRSTRAHRIEGSGAVDGDHDAGLIGEAIPSVIIDRRTERRHRHDRADPPWRAA